MTDGISGEAEMTFLGALVESTVETLRTMAMLEASCVRQCREPECGLGWDVGARMALTSGGAGCIGVATGMECARKIVGRIVGQEAAEVDDDEASAGLAEVLNMIAGNAKTRLAGTPQHFELSLPEPWKGRTDAPCEAPAKGLTAVFDVEGAAFAVCAHMG